MSGSYRPTWSEIKLGAVKHNLGCIKRVIDRDVKVMAVVKANAYGHGINRISSTLVEEGIDYLGVATVDEALIVRNAGIDVPVLVLGAVLENEARAAVKNNVTLTLCDKRLLQTLLEIAKETKVRPRVHIKVDTGMGRIGVWHENIHPFIQEVDSCHEIEVEGIYTHFSSAARDVALTQMQIDSFSKVISEAETGGVEFRYKHAANSIAIVDWKVSHLNMVRTGILLYGVYPKKGFQNIFRLESVMSLKTHIVHLKDTPPGRAISYGRTYVTQKHTKIATIPIGYADGYGRILSNHAKALLGGKYVRVVGMVTMDQTLLDVGNVEDVKVGDEVVLIGRQGNLEIPIEKIAKLSGTIPYEILSAITERVPRIYT